MNKIRKFLVLALLAGSLLAGAQTVAGSGDVISFRKVGGVWKIHANYPWDPPLAGLSGVISCADLSDSGTGCSGLSAPATVKHVCMMPAGSDNAASALLDGDLGPQGRLCFIPEASTVIEVTVSADDGVPSVIPRRNHAGTGANLVSAALSTAASGGLACSKTSAVAGIDGATTCSATLQNTALAAGDWLELASGTAGGTAKRMSIAVTFTTP